MGGGEDGAGGAETATTTALLLPTIAHIVALPFTVLLQTDLGVHWVSSTSTYTQSRGLARMIKSDNH